MNVASWSLPLLSGAFVLCAGIIAVFGVLMTRAARDLAHRTGLGELLVGAVLVGAATSLAGITTSVTAAWSGHAGLAVSNALGGIAAQTAFLAIADIVYRRANLELRRRPSKTSWYARFCCACSESTSPARPRRRLLLSAFTR